LWPGLLCLFFFIRLCVFVGRLLELFPLGRNFFALSFRGRIVRSLN
jgi:hypothetical protein